MTANSILLPQAPKGDVNYNRLLKHLPQNEVILAYHS